MDKMTEQETIALFFHATEWGNRRHADESAATEAQALIDCVNLMLSARAQAIADRDAHIAQAHERVMALASALQDVVAVASNLYAWDWSHHLADSKGGDDVRKELRALERASVAARPLLKQLREELHESCVEEWRRSEKRSTVESIDWLKYARKR